MASQEDCFFFFNSTCTKGDDCAFRHDRGAVDRGAVVDAVCEQWKNGSSERNSSHLPHGTMEQPRHWETAGKSNNFMLRETPKSSVPCYYENQPSGCLNFNCNFLHQKPRPFRPDYQFNNATQASNPRSSMEHQRFNTPFHPRFPHPHMQQFRGPPRPRMEFSPRKMQTIPHPQRFIPTGILPAVFHNTPRERVPNIRDVPRPNMRNVPRPNMRDVPQLDIRYVLRPNIRNVPPPNIGDVPRSNIGELRSVHPESFREIEMSLVNCTVAGEKTFEPKLPALMITTVSRPPMKSSFGQTILRDDDRIISNQNHIAIRNDGPGLLGEPPNIQFPFGGVFPYNIPEHLAKKVKERLPTEVKHSAKRTVKKFDKRHGKSVKTLKHHGERRTVQDDIKRKKKERRSSSKDLRGTTNKHRKVRKDGLLSKKSMSERKVDSTTTAIDDEADFQDIDNGFSDEVNLAFGVKTLEEILRDRAVKKLRERQQMEEGVSSGVAENAGTCVTPGEVEKTSVETDDSLTNVAKITDNTVKVSSQLKSRRIPPLRTMRKAKRLEGNNTPVLETSGEALSSCGDNVIAGKSGERNIDSNICTVNVKSLDEIKRSKLAKLEQTPDASTLKTISSDVTKTTSRKLKPLKPLRNTGRGRKLGTTGGKQGMSGSGGSVSNATSDEDQKRPLPPIAGITDVPRSTVKTLAEILLKRKLAPKAALKQTVTPSKVRRLASSLKSGYAGSVIQKALGKVECGYVDASSVKEIEVSASLQSKEENVTKLSDVKCRLTASAFAYQEKLCLLGTTGGKQDMSGSGGSASNVTSAEDQKRPLPPIARITDVPRSTVKTLAERLLKRKLAPKTLKQTVTPSKVRRLASSLKSGHEGSVIKKTLGKVECGDVDANSVKEIEVSASLQSKEEKVTKLSDVKSRLAPSVQEIPKTKDVALTSVSIKCLERQKGKDNLDGASRTSKVVENQEKLTKVTGKPVKKIKIKRLGLARAKIGTEDEGKIRISSSGLAWRVNRQKLAKVNKDVVPSLKQNKNDVISQENTVKEDPNTAVADSQMSTNITDAPSTLDAPCITDAPCTTDSPNTTYAPSSTNAPSTTVNDDSKPCIEVASKDVNSRALEKKSKVSKLTKASKPGVEFTRNEDASKTIKGRLLSEEKSLKGSLDKLLKEVSADIEDDDLLDEALERAIAELSPVETDDEGDISSADDLLLEIEEMMNN